MLSAPSPPDTTPPATARWVAAWLPRLPTDRLRRPGAAPADSLPEGPLALSIRRGNAVVLHAVDAAAAAAGLAPGMALADARAMRPDLAVLPADPTAEARLLRRLAAWCERFTPLVVPDPPDGLLLEIGGSAHLFGGEAGLCAAVAAGLAGQGMSARVAVAPNPAAAWGLVRFGGPAAVAADGLAAALAALPVAALRLPEAAAALLARLGLRRIGQVMAAPRAPFAARAGQAALLRLDQVLGRAPVALAPHRPPPPVFVLHRALEPVVALTTVLRVVERLCRGLAARLDAGGLAARRLRLLLFGVDGRTRRVELGLTRPARDPALLLRLLRERLDRAAAGFDAAFGFEVLRLDALEVAPLALATGELDRTGGRDPAAEARLVDTLAARLGADRVVRPVVAPVHAPERAGRWAAADAPAAPSPAASPPADGVMRRPLLLLAPAEAVEVTAMLPDGPPARFRWRRSFHHVVRAEGPERIMPDWLRAPRGRVRDYYRVEDEAGRRFWLYREGLYDEARAPIWFLHGFFA